MKRVSVICGALLLACLAGGAYAQQPSLEELERQLKAKEADKAAAQRRAAEAAAEERRRAEEVAAAQEAARTRPGLVFRDPLRSGGEGPAMVIVPSGRFEQGSPSYEGERGADEGPVRMVQVQKVALGQYEVTRGEFRRFVEATGYRTDAERNTAANGTVQGCVAQKDGRSSWQAGTNWRNPGFSQGDDHPVVCVSWNDAMAYAEWLSRETGKGYWLPSESEQEYVVRAGTVTPWPWGSSGDAGCSVANYLDMAAKARFPGATTAGCNDGHEYTSPVGSFRATAFGLYDTSGNVFEWSEDCYYSTYSDAPTDGSAWGSGDCSRRVFRGGSWLSWPAGLRSANRDWAHPAGRSVILGFRLARTL